MSKTQILIVEDDESLNKMLATVLELDGYQVFRALNAEEALEILDLKLDIACVIQDLGLPPNPASMEAGLEVMRKIQAKKPGIKIIVFTGKDKQEAASKAIAEGAFDFFEKPVAIDLLVSSIERSLLFAEAEQNLQNQGTYLTRLKSELDNSGLKGAKDEFEERLVRQVLQDVDYNIRLASERLGLRRENIYYLIRKHNINMDRD